MTKTTISLIAAAVLLHANEPYEITITSATNSEQSIKDVTSNVEVITGTELEEKHITTVLDALRLSGISISQNGAIGQQSSFFMNGMSSGNTLVLVDGIKYNDPTGTEGQAQLEHLMISDIEQIEIIKGAQSGIWGANAVAGVINIITKKPTNELKTNTNIEYGTNNTKKIGLNVSQKLDKLSYFVGANYIKTDGISAQTPNGKEPSDYEDDGYRNKTINAKIGYEITDEDELKFNITDIDAKVEYDPYGNPNGDQNELTQKNRLYQASLQHNFNDKDYVKLSISNTTFKKDDPLGWTKKFEGVNDEVAIDTKFSYLENSFLLFGAVNQNSEDKISKKEIDSSGYYITNSNIFGSLVLTESLRYDKYDLFKNKTTGKIGAKYSFADDIALSGNYGTAYKVPALYELFDSWSGSEALTPSEIKSQDLSLKAYNFSAKYFHNDIENEILYSSSTYKYYNELGTSTIKGYELNYFINEIQDFLINLNHIQYDAKDKDGYQLAKRPKSTSKFSLEYFGISKTILGFESQYIGERVEYDFGTHNIKAQTGQYTLTNIFVNYDIDKNIKTYFKIDNLTDRLYQEVYGYGTSGRAFYVGLNATF